MPQISNSIAISPDKQYILAAGNYKPSLKCYDVNDMSLKFERGLDSDVMKILPLTEDFSKVRLLTFLVKETLIQKETLSFP